MSKQQLQRYREIIHPLTVARDHLCFISGMYVNDCNCVLADEDMKKIEECITEIDAIRQELTKRKINEQLHVFKES